MAGSRDVFVIFFASVVCSLDCLPNPVGVVGCTLFVKDCFVDFGDFIVDFFTSDSVEAFSVCIVCFVGSFDILDVGCLIEVADSLLSEVLALEDSVSTGVNGVVVVYRNVVDTVPCCVVVRIVELFKDVEVIADVLLVESAGSVLANSDAFLLI